jgi:(E)-4-hydroxy-3-methylbut-2-enyl-diphosphate synthase
MQIKRRKTRAVHVGDLVIGDAQPVRVQSMAATKTQNIEATVAQVRSLVEHGADIVRIAVDSKRDVEALALIRKQVPARLVVDLQESYRLAELVAPHVDKIRYNPGHLHHHEKGTPLPEKIKYLVEVARRHQLALRVGVNFGSLDPAQREQAQDPKQAALESVAEHIGILEDLNFQNYVVSLKSSDPNAVVEINQAFAAKYPQIPLHLGVTEAGMLPMGEIKTRVAFENLLANGIGDTMRVSLTLPHEEKYQEILIAKKIIEDVAAGRFRSVPRFEQQGLNIISCPSCSRVENEAFVELARQVRDMAQFAASKKITIAVMGCRVNGPGETDDADLGLWCAPRHVNFKRRGELIGAFGYDEILARVRQELEALVQEQAQAANA